MFIVALNCYLPDLQIREHPKSATYVSGACVVLSVSAIGSEPLHYKWKKNGEDITDPECTGINTPTLTIGSFSRYQQGNYFCIVNNSQKTVETEPANLALGNTSILVVCNKSSECSCMTISTTEYPGDI